jgi:hypothetical protein
VKKRSVARKKSREERAPAIAVNQNSLEKRCKGFPPTGGDDTGNYAPEVVKKSLIFSGDFPLPALAVLM